MGSGKAGGIDFLQQATLEHTFDDVFRGADHVVILVSHLDLGEHVLVDVEGGIAHLDVLACLFLVPCLKFLDEREIKIVGPVIDLEDVGAVLCDGFSRKGNTRQ